MSDTSSRPLSLQVRRQGAAIVIAVRGSATTTEADRMQRSLEALAAEKPPLIVLDLSDMDFICSRGLGALIATHLKVRKHDGHVRLVNPQPPVRQLLEMTRLTRLFPIYPSVEEAASLADPLAG